MNALNTVAEMRLRLATLHPSQMEIIDESAAHAGHAGTRSGAGHYRLHIIAEAFAGQNTVGRHRAVYTALDDLMQLRIHALTITAQTPAEAGQ